MNWCEDDIKIDPTRKDYTDMNLTDYVISSRRIHWWILRKLSLFHVKGEFITCHSLSAHKKGNKDSSIAENRKSSPKEKFT